VTARSREYERHLASDEWQALRAARITAARGRCERCGDTEGLQLHHRSYDRLGKERDDDLELLCWRCHAEADQDRAEEQAELERSRRVEAFAEAKYGDDWTFLVDLDQAEAEYDAWTEDWGDE
jgi:5-methylcytosine-specific restriction endonuclease McrA